MHIFYLLDVCVMTYVRGEKGQTPVLPVHFYRTRIGLFDAVIVSSYVAHLEGLVRLESIRAGRSFAFSLIQLYKFAVSSAILELPSLETKYHLVDEATTTGLGSILTNLESILLYTQHEYLSANRRLCSLCLIRWIRLPHGKMYKSLFCLPLEPSFTYPWVIRYLTWRYIHRHEGFL